MYSGIPQVYSLKERNVLYGFSLRSCIVATYMQNLIEAEDLYSMIVIILETDAFVC